MFPYCKNTAASRSSFAVEPAVALTSNAAQAASKGRNYTWTVTQDPCKCADSACSGVDVHSFMMAISKECETASKRFTMYVNGKVRRHSTGPLTVLW